MDIYPISVPARWAGEEPEIVIMSEAVADTVTA